MRSLILYFILVGSISYTLCRPSHLEEDSSEVDETEYEDEKTEDDDASLNEEQSPVQEAEEDKSGDQQGYNINDDQNVNYEEQTKVTFVGRQKSAFENQRKNSYNQLNQNLEDGKEESNSLHANKQSEYDQQYEAKMYVLPDEAQPMTPDNKRDTYKLEKLRGSDTAEVDTKKMLMSNQKEGNVFVKRAEDEEPPALENDYYNEITGNNNQGQNSNKIQKLQSYITQRGKLDNKLSISHRERRGANDSIEKETTTVSDVTLDKNDPVNTDEEIAIKNHIKKLSTEEFNELLNTLSEDKKTLLKKILDNDQSTSSDNVEKREITKKAGAMEENNLVEANQGDNCNLQPSSLSADGSSLVSVTSTESRPESSTDNGKITSSSSDTGNGRMEIKSDLINISDKNTLNSAASATSAPIDSNSNFPTKIESKRETNKADMKSPLPDDSQLLEDECNFKETKRPIQDSSINLATSKDSKQDAYINNEEDYYNSFKSLEESFPSTYDESGSYVGPGTGPLVRVKRKNLDMTVNKRAAAILPDAKVAYFHYKSGNQEEDANEGNEFDDDGFYDRSSNTGYENNNPQKNNVNSEMCHNLTEKMEVEEIQKTENLETDTSVGSDADSVNTGADGVDDNLMYSSSSRNRRTIKINDIPSVKTANISQNIPNQRYLRSTPLIDNDMDTASKNYVNAQNYQENDAFGPLPRSYEGELNRFKRIRHVKQINVPGGTI